MNTKIRLTAVAAALLLLAGCAGSPDAGTSTPSDSPASTESESQAPSEEPAEAPKEVEPLPINSSGLLFGNATPNFPDGEPNKVSVVHVGTLLTDRGTLPFAFRNNTSEAISHVDWSATARSGGSIVGSGNSHASVPDQVQPGEVGLAYIYFDNAEAIAADAEYEFSAETSPADTSSYNTAPIKVTEANLVGEAIVGGGVNETGALTEGPYSVDIFCFDGDNLVGQTSTFTNQDGPIDNGGTVSFSNDLYGNTCDSFLVGIGGYFS